MNFKNLSEFPFLGLRFQGPGIQNSEAAPNSCFLSSDFGRRGSEIKRSPRISGSVSPISVVEKPKLRRRFEFPFLEFDFEDTESGIKRSFKFSFIETQFRELRT